MGSLTFQIVGDASVGTKTKTYAVSDADVNRFVAWATAQYATKRTVAVPNPPALTVAQALNAWANEVVNGMKNNVVTRENSVALAAVPPPPPFTAT